MLSEGEKVCICRARGRNMGGKKSVCISVWDYCRWFVSWREWPVTAAVTAMTRCALPLKAHRKRKDKRVLWWWTWPTRWWKVKGANWTARWLMHCVQSNKTETVTKCLLAGHCHICISLLVCFPSFLPSPQQQVIANCPWKVGAAAVASKWAWWWWYCYQKVKEKDRKWLNMQCPTTRCTASVEFVKASI